MVQPLRRGYPSGSQRWMRIMDLELFLDEYPQTDGSEDSSHHLVGSATWDVPPWHAAGEGQKEVECMFCQGHRWQNMPHLNPEPGVDQSAMELVGYWNIQKGDELLQLYLEVCNLLRLPGSPLLWRTTILEEGLSSRTYSLPWWCQLQRLLQTHPSHILKDIGHSCRSSAPHRLDWNDNLDLMKSGLSTRQPTRGHWRPPWLALQNDLERLGSEHQEKIHSQGLDPKIPTADNRVGRVKSLGTHPRNWFKDQPASSQAANPKTEPCD